ncbi:MAG TPA: hypothetical protein VFQ81_02320 [Candidatus Limnocylindria bacterium]|nr:hypothetical protein [Candidatus Limnocylindria bacterium]
MPREEAGAAVERVLLNAIGPEAAVEIAQAQARVAWEEVVAEAGLARGGMRSRLVRVANGIGHVEASEPILANELRLRGEALAWAVNRRMTGRPGATIALRGVAVSVARFE